MGPRMKYMCSFYYGTDGPLKRPWRKGELAISTEHSSLSSAQMEIRAGKDRPEIGKIIGVGPDLDVVWYRTQEAPEVVK